jgi:hypothetical protein
MKFIHSAIEFILRIYIEFIPVIHNLKFWTFMNVRTLIIIHYGSFTLIIIHFHSGHSLSFMTKKREYNIKISIFDFQVR